ncbi:MAG: hypothetical protein HY721_35345 [Planctomycetes bacterium]|nr:hypothetical protein [Planctomycetota bacterium]
MSTAISREPKSSDEETAPGEALPEPALVAEVKDFVRSLVVVDKHILLYPKEGRVVQGSLGALFSAFQKFRAAAGGPLRLEVRQLELVYEDAVVYQEARAEVSLASRLHKDFVKEVVFQEDLTLEELMEFLVCLKESRAMDRVEDDLCTLFWEKDFTHVQVKFLDDMATDLGPSSAPAAGARPERMDLVRFSIDEEEHERLQRLVAERTERLSDGDPALELTEVDLKAITQLADAEEAYFPLYDFLSILVQIRSQGEDFQSFQDAMSLVRSVLVALFTRFEFAHAEGMIRKLKDEHRWSLTDAQRQALKEMLRSLCDKATLRFVGIFLRQAQDLPAEHDVFKLMAALEPEAAPYFCELLSHRQHAPAIREVLRGFGGGLSDVYAPYLLSPDPDMACAVMDLLLVTDKNAGDRIAAGLRHEDERVRIAAAKSLVELGDPRCGPSMAPLLRERSVELASLAIQFFAKTTCPAAFRDLAAFTRTGRFLDLDHPTKEQCFKGLLDADPEQGIRLIADDLLRWSIFEGKRSVQRKRASLWALRHHPRPECLTLLRRLAKRKHGQLGAAARCVLGIVESAARRRDLASKGVRDG